SVADAHQEVATSFPMLHRHMQDGIALPPLLFFYRFRHPTFFSFNILLSFFKIFCNCCLALKRFDLEVPIEICNFSAISSWLNPSIMNKFKTVLYPGERF